MPTAQDRQLEEAFARVRESGAAIDAAWDVHASVTPTTLELTRHLRTLKANAEKAANSLAYRTAQLTNKDVSGHLPLEHRRDLAREARVTTEAELKKLQDAEGGALQLMQSELKLAALPKLDRDREMAARDEARMILNGSDDPVSTMVELARRDDEVGAVVTSVWGRSYLTAKRVEQPNEVAAMVRRVASASAVEATDPERRAIGEALVALGENPNLYAASTFLVQQALDAAAKDAATLNGAGQR